MHITIGFGLPRARFFSPVPETLVIFFRDCGVWRDVNATNYHTESENISNSSDQHLIEPLSSLQFGAFWMLRVTPLEELDTWLELTISRLVFIGKEGGFSVFLILVGFIR